MNDVIGTCQDTSDGGPLDVPRSNAGVYIGGMWDLDAPAADCAADGRYELFATAAPLTLTGAIGLPLAPLAVR